MHKEVVTTKHALLFFIIAIITLGLILMSILSCANITHYKWIYEFGIVVIIALGIYLFQKFYLTGYNYTFIQDIIIFKKFIGKKEISLLTLELANIVGVYSYDQYLKEKDNYDIRSLSNFTGHFNSSDIYAIIYKDKEKIFALKFCPSKDFYNMLCNKIKSVNIEQKAF